MDNILYELLISESCLVNHVLELFKKLGECLFIFEVLPVHQTSLLASFKYSLKSLLIFGFHLIHFFEKLAYEQTKCIIISFESKVKVIVLNHQSKFDIGHFRSVNEFS